jgi:YggT family protein
MGTAILFLIDSILRLLTFAVVVNAILSWLIAFDVLNYRNPLVANVARGLDQVMTPLLKPIRRFIPVFGGIDISPVILILLLQAVGILIDHTIAGPLIGLLG